MMTMMMTAKIKETERLDGNSQSRLDMGNQNVENTSCSEGMEHSVEE